MIAGGEELTGIIQVLEQYQIPYEQSESFDKDRSDYGGICAIISGSNRVDYFGSPENRADEAFQHLDRFIREGGHLFCFGAFNGRNFHHLRRYGFVTGSGHGYRVAHTPPYSDLLFHGLNEGVPDSMELHLVGQLSVETPHVVMLVRGETPHEGTPVLASVGVESGRVSVLMAEPYYKNSMWILPIAVHWVARGAPTTFEQLQRSPVVDPFTLRAHRMGAHDFLQADRLRDLQSLIPDSLSADQLLSLARESTEHEQQLAALLAAAEKYALVPNADSCLGALLAAAQLDRLDLLTEQARLLDKSAARVEDPAEAAVIARQALDAYEDAFDAYRFQLAWAFANIAVRSAAVSRSGHYRDLADRAQRRTGPIHAAWQRVGQAFHELQNHPQDPQLNAMMGRFFTFVVEDWDIGLACLANGNDETLQELARLSQTAEASPLDRLRLADRWLQFAKSLPEEEREAVEHQVRWWYTQIHRDLDQLTRQDQERVTAYLDQPGAETAVVNVRMTLDGYGLLRINNEALHWETLSGAEPRAIQIDGQQWNPADGAGLKNRGSTRFLPSGVEVGTVRVEKTTGRGVVLIEKQRYGEVVIRVNDVPAGRGDYQFKILFGE